MATAKHESKGTEEEVHVVKRQLTGLVVSDKSTKTIVVNVVRKVMHPKYHKFVKRTKKYHAHDEKSTAKVGDTVTIIESRPYSKLKKWALLQIKSNA